MNLNSASLFSMFVYGDHAIGEPGPYGSTIIGQQKDGAFYALAFYLPDSNEVVVAYRGTDDEGWNIGDKLTGWPIGVGLYGLPETQADKAFAFYNDMLVDIADPSNPAHVASTASISFTGHSLGGGLAGLVSSLNHKPAYIFDAMPFVDSANNLYDDVTGENAASHAYWSALAFPNGVPQEPSFAQVQSVAMAGEALESLRNGMGIQIGPDWVVFTGNDALTINQHQIQGGSLTDPVELHSMGLLAIAMHAGLEHSDDERVGGGAMYKYLFDGQFAAGLGFASTTALQDALAYSLSEGTSSLDSFFSDMAIIGSMLRTGPGPYADALARMAITHAADIAADVQGLRSGLIEVATGYANIALDGVHDAQRMIFDLVQHSSEALNGLLIDIPTNGLSNIAVELSGYGGEVHLGPGGTLYFGSLYNDDIYGSASDDVIVSLGNDDLFFDVIRGGGGNDLIFASTGDDIIYGGAGNDTLNGGAGDDKAHYMGNMADYGIAIVGDKIRLTDTIANRDGVDTLTGIEELVFADGSIMTANLPKAPTSFQVTHNDIHTHVSLLGSYLQLHLLNIVDADGGVNQLEIDPTVTDAAILPYIQLVTLGSQGVPLHARITEILAAGNYQVGFRTYDAANNVRSETQVVSLQIHDNVAPTAVSWQSGGTIYENSGVGTVGYLNIHDVNSASMGSGSGEKYSVRLVGDYSHTYEVVRSSDEVFRIDVLDPGNVDYERDASPTLAVEVTDIAGNVGIFSIDVNVTNTANTSWTAPVGQNGYSSSKTGTSQDDTLNATNSLLTWTLNGGGGSDTIYGGSGNDTIDGGVGNDVMRGNGGNDRFYSYAGSDTIYGGSGTDNVDLSALYRPQYVDDAYMSGGFLVIERDDTVVKIYQDVEGISMGVPWVGNLGWSIAGYLAEYQSFHP